MTRFLLPALSVAAVLALQACPPAAAPCSPSNCDGCCTESGECAGGGAREACGTGGVQCSVCAVNESCGVAGCAPAGGSGDGGQSADAGGAENDGGLSDGGSADAGPGDAGETDGGTMDAGTADAGADAGAPACTPFGFSAPAKFAAGSFPVEVRAADLSGDGLPDLVVTNAQSGSFSVLINDGKGSFGAAKTYSAAQWTAELAVADFDGDGHPDVAVSNFLDNSVHVRKNLGNGNLGGATVYPGVSGAWAMDSADVNGDGKRDLVLADGSAILSMLNTGAGAFAMPISTPVSNGAFGLALAPLTPAPGPSAATVGHTYSNTVTVLAPVGNGAFTISGSTPVGGDPIFVTAGDLDGDGHADLVSSNTADSSLSVLHNEWDGGFAAIATLGDAGAKLTEPAIADLDGDGRPDIVVTDQESPGHVVLFWNAGDGGWPVGAELSGVSAPAGIVVSDFNGDGRPDLATANGSNDVAVFLNQCP